MNNENQNPFQQPFACRGADKILKALLMLALIIFLAILSANQWKQRDYIGKSEENPHTITISGEGKVIGVPDIALISLGLNIEKTTVAAAQEESTKKMNDIIKALKDLSIEEKDIQTTTYSIYPRYDYIKDRGQVLRGYAVNQRVQVKIRDLSKIGAVVAKGTELGANQVGSLSFTIDEPEELRQEAREKAIANAKEKAEALADAADVKLGKVVNFSESTSGSIAPRTMVAEMAYGKGGGDEEMIMPDIEEGSMEIIIYATISYEIL